MIQSKEEWDKLPELEVSKIANPEDKGNIYNIKKVGFVRHKTEEGIEILPLVYLDDDQIYRLPQEFSSWVYDSVAMAHSGMNPFPSKVEFGILNGEYYAEII